MSLYKRNNIWWVDITFQGRRIQKSTGTSNKANAQRYHDELKASLWRQEHLNEKPDYLWIEAAERWITESSHKKSLADDKAILRWLDPYLSSLALKQITSDLVSQLAKTKMREGKKGKGAKPATANRMMALIRAILRKAVTDWKWLEVAPTIKLLREDNERVRWLKPEEAVRLIKALPSHLAAMAAFSLATGLRQANVTQLKWENVDLERRHVVIHPNEAKGKKGIPVPLNEDAVRILQAQLGKHAEYVFVYRDKPVTQCTTKAWYKALKNAGISDFRWHDLRHTWATWHTQNGTSSHELQQLGGWSSFEMTFRYAHLSSDHLKKAANNVVGITNTQSVVIS